ncbi:MAG: hypothetical protein F6J90_35645 [Moorea sp. SIOASIH]|nr:hypothetical protein [Moorena sp. SIOASIH]NEO41373.1 hypothetical protein [Moorena sp. SIOASIH]NEO97102.1 hypothetical protein [Moorena sp. SIO3G5]
MDNCKAMQRGLGGFPHERLHQERNHPFQIPFNQDVFVATKTVNWY